MADTLSCLKCGSSKLMTNVKIVDHGPNSNHDLSIEFDKTPDAFFFKKFLDGAHAISITFARSKSVVKYNFLK